MSTGKILLGVLAGMAAGATLGILFAPEKGSETRRKMAEKADDYADSLKEKLHDLVDEVNDKLDDLKKEAEAFAEKAARKHEEPAQGAHS